MSFIGRGPAGGPLLDSYFQLLRMKADDPKDKIKRKELNNLRSRVMLASTLKKQLSKEEEAA